MSSSSSSSEQLTADQVIKELNLTPHPEKGFYIETFRDPETFTSTTPKGPQPRAHSTCIYYLLKGESGLSHWHRVLDAVEVWHYYAGAPLKLELSWDDGTGVREVVLGKELLKGERPQVVVRKGEWQHARSLGEWTLVGCSVAPAFVFEGFEMAPQGWEPKAGVGVGKGRESE
ncbi:cupin family protein [Xylaria sp. FL0933]|nr:cupin family protein [Xylaria sp. FL0933]